MSYCVAPEWGQPTRATVMRWEIEAPCGCAILLKVAEKPLALQNKIAKKLEAYV